MKIYELNEVPVEGDIILNVNVLISELENEFGSSDDSFQTIDFLIEFKSGKKVFLNGRCLKNEKNLPAGLISLDEFLKFENVDL